MKCQALQAGNNAIAEKGDAYYPSYANSRFGGYPLRKQTVGVLT